MKNKKHIINFVSILIAIVSVIYFIYKCYNNKNEIAEGLSILKDKYWILIIEILLMFLNITLETCRWMVIDYKRSGKKSFKDNFFTITESILLSISTPLGIGEHIGKSRNSNNIKSSFLTSIIGSFIQTSVIILMGFIGFLFINYQYSNYVFAHTFITLLILSITAIIIYHFKKKTIRRILNEFSIKKISIIYFINISRYIIFAYQMYLMQTLSIDIFNIKIVSLILIYYLIITIIPSSGLADIGIRGSIAIAVIGDNINSWSGIAAILIWLINKIIPSIIGFQSIIFSVIKSSKNHLDSGIR